jgi:peptidoglycan/xylan/chitin deacetylase (PgdA/CDA1 family)
MPTETRETALSDFWERSHGFYIRSTARFFFSRPLRINTPVPLISFSFDDFPRSALQAGGAILKRFGLAGTYYVALGLMGKQTATGEMFLYEDLKELIEQGHELGCHTFDHFDSWKTETTLFEASIIKNRRALSQLFPGLVFKVFSYPISPPRARTKRQVAPYFACCRGGGQTFNAEIADLNYLAAYFLEKSRDNFEAVKNLIDQNQRTRGWLVLATHDVSDDPTPYGCTPEFFENVVQYAVRSGSRILPVAQALEALRASAS